jgi:hypothetical protein
VTETLVIAIFLAAVCGAAAAGLYLAWPRRLTAEEWVLHRRVMSAPPVSPVSPSRSRRPRRVRLTARVEQFEGLLSAVGADLALLRLGGQPVPTSTDELLRGLGLRAGMGGLGGLLLLGLLMLSAGGEVSPLSASLPLVGAILWPAWSWLSLRRRAARLRAAVEQRLPRLLVAARVLLESGAATPEGSLTHVVAIYEDPAADLVREALVAKEVRRLPLETTLDEVAQTYGVTTVMRLADSFRVGVRYGTRMAELLGEQSAQMRQAWFAAYRERIARAPILMTIPALLFFVAPLLVLIVFLVFTPLVGALGQL